MFIKKVEKRNGKTEKVYRYLHLVESVRTENGPRQRLVLNLGNLNIHPSQYKSLARRIEDILTGQRSFIELDKEIEKYAREAANKIFKKQAKEIAGKSEPDYQMVNVNSLESEKPRSLGPEYLCHSIWKDLGMDRFLKVEGVSEKVIPVMESLVVGRLIDPGSERYTRQWAGKRSAIYELIGYPLRESLNSYYRAGDKLYSLKDSLEKHLSRTEKTLFSLSEKMVFIDLTNTYFEGQAEKNPKAKRGHSKERRKDCKLVTLGLIIDEMGFAKYSQLFPGNQSDGETLSEMIKSMEQNIHCSAKDQTIVIDAGIATEENIKWLRDNKYHYIAVNRGKVPIEIDYTQMEVIKEDKAKGIKVEVKRFSQEGEIYILCKSKQKAAKEISMRQRVEDLFLERLEYYKAGLLIPRRTKKYNKIIELIGRLKEKYAGAAKLYTVEVIPEKDKPATDPYLLAKKIIWKKKKRLYREEIEQEGSYILRSDRLDLSNADIWKTHVMLTQIESAFKSMKSFLGLRPNFHQKENRVDTHMFISVLAYHILHIIEYHLRQRGDCRSWATIRNILSTHNRSTICYQTKDETGQVRQQFVRVSSGLEAEHLEIYRKFKLSGNPLPRRKIEGNIIVKSLNR